MIDKITETVTVRTTRRITLTGEQVNAIIVNHFGLPPDTTIHYDCNYGGLDEAHVQWTSEETMEQPFNREGG